MAHPETMQTIDHLIQARWIIPVEPENTLFEHHACAIHEGRILEILPQEAAKTKYSATVNDQLDEHVLGPVSPMAACTFSVGWQMIFI